MYVNWGAKFLADTLMLEEKLMNEFEQAVLRGERLGPGDIADEVIAQSTAVASEKELAKQNVEPATSTLLVAFARRPQAVHVPLPANSFDFVFSEHTIEHVQCLQRRQMIAGCRRAL